MLTPQEKAAACPDDELLASFVDGRLSDPERARVVTHLADCARCRALARETARVQDELHGEARRPLRPSFVRRFAAPLAASLLLTVGAGGLWTATRPRALSESELVEPLRGHPAALDHLWSGGITRGAADAASLTGRSFRFGVLLVDVELSLAAEDEPRARERLQLATSLLRSMEFMDEDAAFFVEAQRSLGSPDGRAAVARELGARAERWPSRFDGRYLAFGEWVEAGRLAALSGNPAPFRSLKYRRFPRWLESVAGESLDPATRADLVSVARQMPDAARADAGALGALASTFTRVVIRIEALPAS
jgi:Putative zinc-finger